MTRRRWVLLLAGAAALSTIGVGVVVLFVPGPRLELRPKFSPLGPRFPGGPLACTADADCTLTHDVDGECCSTACDIGTAYSRAFSNALHDEIKRACAGMPCPSVMCAVGTGSDSPIPDHRLARCLGGKCQMVFFTWSNARIADVTVAGEHARIQFESNGLRLTVREDGYSFGDLPNVYPYSDSGSALSGVVSQWRAERGNAKDRSLPGVEEKLAREKLELLSAVDRLIADLKAPPASAPPLSAPLPSASAATPNP